MDSTIVLLLVTLTASMTLSIPDRMFQSNYRRTGSNNNQRSGQGHYKAVRYHDPDRVVFPDDFYRNTVTKGPLAPKRNIAKSTDIHELPLDLAIRLNELGDVNAFLDEFLENKEEFRSDNDIPDTVVTIDQRIGIPTKTSKKGFSIKQVCSPVPTTIRLAPENHSPDVLYLPECAHVQRCSGCCNTGLLSCQPIKTHNITFRVFENKLSISKKKLRYNKSFDVEIEEHLSCGCKCRIQEHHCQSTQRYESHSCRCVCNDDLPNGKDECEAYGKVWDEFTCSCNCPEDVTQHCTTGSNFDDEICACMKK